MSPACDPLVRGGHYNPDSPSLVPSVYPSLDPSVVLSVGLSALTIGLTFLWGFPPFYCWSDPLGVLGCTTSLSIYDRPTFPITGLGIVPHVPAIHCPHYRDGGELNRWPSGLWNHPQNRSATNPSPQNFFLDNIYKPLNIDSFSLKLAKIWNLALSDCY